MTLAAQRVADYLVPEFGDRDLASLRAHDVRAYRLSLERAGLKSLTVEHVLSDLRCMLGVAVDDELIPRSPFPRRVMPRRIELPPDRLTDTEVDRVLVVPEPHAFVIRLGLGTGLRWSELCRLAAGDLQQGMLLIARTKSGRMRRVPVPEELQVEIASRGSALVPFGCNSSGSFSRTVRRHSGVRAFHVHQLRHTFACRWLESGGSLVALQQILGHADISTTQRYARLSDEYVRREATVIHRKGLAQPDTTGTGRHKVA